MSAFRAAAGAETLGKARLAQTGIYRFQGADGAQITMVNTRKLNSSTKNVSAKTSSEKK